MTNMSPEDPDSGQSASDHSMEGLKFALISVVSGVALLATGGIGYSIGSSAGEQSFEEERSRLQSEIRAARGETDKAISERDAAVAGAEWDREYYGKLKSRRSARESAAAAASNPRPSQNQSPPPQQQESVRQQAPQRPSPPYPAGAGKEWATMGPYGLQSTCTQASDSWPLDYTDCFQVDGSWHYYGIRQSA